MAVAHKIYAEALLEAATEKDELARIREEFGDLAAAVAESDDLREFLRNPQIESPTKRAVLESILDGASDYFTNFVRLLVEKDRIAELADVHDEWERLLARAERVLELELVTAVELSDEEADDVVRRIEEASGRKVVARRRVDADILGGIVVQAGSQRLDASVRGRLNALRQDLARSY
jgi:F-type H+-transporting ATPase subunit delta